NWAQENANAIIDAWYPGEMGGKAFAQLIFGDYSPSGRLPVTFYKTSDELPAFDDYSMKGRTYRYMENEPLYPFGYGLSYTDFVYSSITADCTHLNETETVNIKFEVKNAGAFDGYEKIQIYVSPLSPSVITPLWELKYFKAVYLKKGEKSIVSIDLPLNAFTLVDENGNRFVERGAFRIYAGGSQPGQRSEELTGKTVNFTDIII
ncbi:MAG: glycoside hydrolase family 3 C-terminal domain-containing protein, partial [Eubacteriales bacterium]